jgi:hypothetical protein
VKFNVFASFLLGFSCSQPDATELDISVYYIRLINKKTFKRKGKRSNAVRVDSGGIDGGSFVRVRVFSVVK